MMLRGKQRRGVEAKSRLKSLFKGKPNMDNVLNAPVTQTSGANSKTTQFCPSVLNFSLEPRLSNSIREQMYVHTYTYMHTFKYYMYTWAIPCKCQPLPKVFIILRSQMSIYAGLNTSMKSVLKHKTFILLYSFHRQISEFSRLKHICHKWTHEEYHFTITIFCSI